MKMSEIDWTYISILVLYWYFRMFIWYANKERYEMEEIVMESGQGLIEND